MRRRALLASMSNYNTSSDEWDYLTIVAEEDLTLEITNSYTESGSDLVTGYFYRSKNGGAWDKYSGKMVQLAMKNGDEIRLKSDNINRGYSALDFYDDTDFANIKSTGSFRVRGTVMSLLYGDDFRDKSSMEGFTLNHLFGCLKDSGLRYIESPSVFLPATTLSEGCYKGLLLQCDKLENAPLLPAEVLAKDCYYYMFNGCTKISYLKMLATDISATNCLYNWVYGVASNGTFVKHPEATWSVRGRSGVPSGWTIKFDGEE